jgi:hypothetical protein
MAKIVQTKKSKNFCSIKCASLRCDKREKCHRFMAEDSSEVQIYFYFDVSGSCGAYLPTPQSLGLAGIQLSNREKKDESI